MLHFHVTKEVFKKIKDGCKRSEFRPANDYYTKNLWQKYLKDYLDDNEFYYEWNYRHDGASKIAKVLFEEATDINFYVGKAINPAHQNSDLPISFNLKMNLVEELSKCLKKMGKRIKVSYF
mgnify:CR=1 FL=1